MGLDESGVFISQSPRGGRLCENLSEAETLRELNMTPNQFSNVNTSEALKIQPIAHGSFSYRRKNEIQLCVS